MIVFKVLDIYQKCLKIYGVWDLLIFDTIVDKVTWKGITRTDCGIGLQINVLTKEGIQRYGEELYG